MTLKQLIKQIGCKEFTSLFSLNKFELCALNKLCDNFLGILEVVEVLDGTQDHELFHHGQDHDDSHQQPAPRMDQVKDLNDILAEINFDQPTEAVVLTGNIQVNDKIQQDAIQPIKRLIDQNGDELKAIWSDAGELLFFNKFGDQVFIEGDVPDDFKPPIPQELLQHPGNRRQELETDKDSIAQNQDQKAVGSENLGEKIDGQ